jgi:hypothetical protein
MVSHTCTNELPSRIIRTSQQRIDATCTGANIKTNNLAGRVMGSRECGRRAVKEVLYPEEVC